MEIESEKNKTKQKQQQIWHILTTIRDEDGTRKKLKRGEKQEAKRSSCMAIKMTSAPTTTTTNREANNRLLLRISKYR